MLLGEPSAAFYQMPARAWELALGGLVAVTGLRLRSTAWGLALVLLACVVPFGHFPGVGALPAVLGAALVIAGTDRVRVLESKPVVSIGLISYSLYLWHWPLLALDRALRVGETPLAVRLGLVATAFLLAAASYRYVEAPFRQVRGRKRVVGVGVTALLCLSAGSVAYASYAPKPIDSDALAVQTMRDMPPHMQRCLVGHAEADLPPRAGCQIGTGPVKVVVWGDSHALAWEPFAMQIAAGRSTLLMGRAGCGPLLPPGHTEEDARCRAFVQAAIMEIQRVRPDVLFIAARWPTYDVSRLDLAQVAPYAKRIVIMGPIPVMPMQAPDCIIQHKVAACAMSRADFDAMAAGPRRILAEKTRAVGAELIDPSAYFCTRRTCPLMRDGWSMYLDEDHPSARAARGFRESGSLSASR
jgi:hypothetical protein